MVTIAAVGSNQFVVGFQLAGIRETIEISEGQEGKANAFSQLKGLKKRKDIGIIIIEEQVMDGLQPHERIELEMSIEPVFIPLSTKIQQDSLRKLIKKSVGIDLWK
jgi:vacuolar-type H+-ATPase subunit F/Vma7